MPIKTYINSVIKLLILTFTSLFIRKHVNIRSNTILIIRLDGFGDYVIFRNYLYWIRKQSRYKDYSITLVGNHIWQEFAEYFDSNVVNNFIWVDRNQFIKCFSYRIDKLKEICKFGYEIVLYPTFLRETVFGDCIAKVVSSSCKIASKGDCEYRPYLENKITNKIYSSIIPAIPATLFEFERLKEFFVNWQNHPIDDVKLELLYEDKAIFDFDYIVMFIGASSDNRKWPVNYFIILAQMLYAKFHLKIIVCGAVSDAVLTDEHNYLIDMIGKTKQLDLVNILKYAKLVVSNETVVPHLCVALNTYVFVIYNGNNFKRFTPYPKYITSKYCAINHPIINKSPWQYVGISNRNNYVTKLAMTDIKPIFVYNVILTTLSGPLAKIV